MVLLLGEKIIDHLSRVNEAEHQAKVYAARRRRRAIKYRSQGTQVEASMMNFEDRPYKERQAALILTQMAQGSALLDAGKVHNIVETLTVSHFL